MTTIDRPMSGRVLDQNPVPVSVPLAIEILDAMDAILAEPKRWTKGAHARDGVGRPVHPEAGVADCWCMAGAHMVARGSHDGTYSWFCIEAATIELATSPHPTFFNDNPRTTFRDVKRVIARARDLALRRRPELVENERVVRPYAPV